MGVGVPLCTCVHKDVAHKCVVVHLYMCIGVEAKSWVGCWPQLLSTLCMDTGSLIEPRDH